jgi:hypothetical protein
LVGSSRLPDAPRISLVVIQAKPIPGLGSIHLPAIRPEPPVPAPLLSEILLLLVLCLVLRGVAKARQLLS